MKSNFQSRLLSALSSVICHSIISQRSKNLDTFFADSFPFSKRFDRNRTRLSKKTGFRANIFSSKVAWNSFELIDTTISFLLASCKAFVCSLTDVKERFSFSLCSRIVMLLFRMNFRLVEFWYNSVISFWQLLKVYIKRFFIYLFIYF